MFQVLQKKKEMFQVNHGGDYKRQIGFFCKASESTIILQISQSVNVVNYNGIYIYLEKCNLIHFKGSLVSKKSYKLELQFYPNL